MLDLEDRLDELISSAGTSACGWSPGRRVRAWCSTGGRCCCCARATRSGLADHPKVRQAAADAAMRWGVGAGAARVSCGTMTLHKRLEERLATFTGQRASLLFGSGALANMGVIGALARRGEVVLHDELAHSSIVDGCRLSGAEVVAYRHADADHLAWTLRQCDGRATLIATDGMFGMDGDVAPLREIVDLAPPLRRPRAGRRGPRARRARARRPRRRRRGRASRARSTSSPARWPRPSAPTAASWPVTTSPLASSCTPPGRCCTPPRCRRSRPRPRWRRWTCWRSNPAASRSCAPTPRRCATAWPARASRSAAPPPTSSRSWSATPSRAARMVEFALDQGVFAEAVRPPAVPEGTARVRVSVMASHQPDELREAAVRAGPRRSAGRVPARRGRAGRRGAGVAARRLKGQTPHRRSGEPAPRQG